MWRGEDKSTSDIHIFSSHFFTALEDGPKAVESWTAKKDIDIFKKKLIFIPINQSLHWSLCVVVNPGAIMNVKADAANTSPDDPFPCMLFFDSLKAHKKSWVKGHVIKWLNSEWKRLGKNSGDDTPTPFTNSTFSVICPKGELVETVYRYKYSALVSHPFVLPIYCYCYCCCCSSVSRQ
jgi:hypothetical protein